MIEAGTFLLILVGFEETMFPRFLFGQRENLPTLEHGSVTAKTTTNDKTEDGKKCLKPVQSAASEHVGQVLPGYEKRTIFQRLKLWTYQPEDKTTYWEYFKRPFFLFAFPNVVLVSHVDELFELPATDSCKAGAIFAFGCTAGIVSFNTSKLHFSNNYIGTLTIRQFLR